MHQGVGARIVDSGDERRRADFLIAQPLRQGLFRLARFGCGAGDPQPGLEAGDQRGLKACHRQVGVRQQGAQGGHPGRRRCALLRSCHVDCGHHRRQVEIDQRRALVHDDVIVEIAAGAADLLPIHDDVGRRAVFGGDAEGREAGRRRRANPRGHVRQGRHTDFPPVADDLPAELALVQIDRAAAGNAPHDADAGLPAVIELQLPAQILVPADQRGRREAQEAHRVRHRAGLAQLHERLVECDLEAAVADAGIDDPESGPVAGLAQDARASGAGESSGSSNSSPGS